MPFFVFLFLFHDIPSITLLDTYLDGGDSVVPWVHLTGYKWKDFIIGESLPHDLYLNDPSRLAKPAVDQILGHWRSRLIQGQSLVTFLQNPHPENVPARPKAKPPPPPKPKKYVEIDDSPVANSAHQPGKGKGKGKEKEGEGEKGIAKAVAKGKGKAIAKGKGKAKAKGMIFDEVAHASAP